MRALVRASPTTDALAVAAFASGWPDAPAWAIGPFARDEALAFLPTGQWHDPTGIGWTSSSVVNPTTAIHDGELHLFYRACPRKESTSSRIGHAVRGRDGVWHDDPANPVLWPTLPGEALGCEDPKLYRADGRWFLFYNAVWDTRGTVERERYPEAGDVGCDVHLAVSDDLAVWEKLGRVVPHEVSRLWAKGAVIPRDGAGRAVRVGGQYLMYLSEGCGGAQTVGRSEDLVHWEFTAQPYLDASPLLAEVFEVACAAVGQQPGELILDAFGRDRAGRWAAVQARYALDAPFIQLDLHAGGSLAWGGLTRLAGARGPWAFAQGWDAPAGQRRIDVYRTASSGGRT